MKSHRVLLLAAILLSIYPTHAAWQQEMKAPIRGQGGSQKDAEKLIRIRKDAEQGVASAQSQLATMYLQGNGVPRFGG